MAKVTHITKAKRFARQILLPLGLTASDHLAAAELALKRGDPDRMHFHMEKARQMQESEAESAQLLLDLMQRRVVAAGMTTCSGEL